MPETFSHGHAVLVGVGADLPVTIADATAIHEILVDSTRCAYPRAQVRLLAGESARRDGIVAALQELAQTVGPNDTSIVYFSGHGTEMPDFHLVPYGFDWKDLGKTAISGKEFTDLLRQIRARKLLVLLDCCHAGGQAEAKEFKQTPMPVDVVSELGGSSGRVVIASSRKNEVSWTGNPYSQFTMAVVEALAGHGSFEQDGYARVLDLALYVGRFVPARTNDQQHPIIKVSNLEDNFAIAWYAGGETTPKKLPWQGGVPTPGTIHDSAQAETWRRMLKNYRDNIVLIEERMSEYVDFSAIPLQLIKSKQQTQTKIEELEARLGGR